MATTASLAEFPLFQNLPEALLDKIAALGKELSFAQGETIFQEGEQADKLHFGKDL